MRFRVLIDGQPPAADHAIDTDEAGYGTIIESRLHQLIRQTGPIGNALFEIKFLDAGIEAYSFKFG